MFKFLILAFLFFIFMIFLFGFSLIRILFQAFLGRPMQKKQPQSKSQRNTTTQSDYSPSKPKKIITQDEGEYIDYEEIKEYQNSN